MTTQQQWHKNPTIPKSARGVKHHSNYPSLAWASLHGKWKVWERRPIWWSLFDPFVTRSEGVPSLSRPRSLGPGPGDHPEPCGEGLFHVAIGGVSPWSGSLDLKCSRRAQRNIALECTKASLSLLFILHPSKHPFAEVWVVLLLSRVDKIVKHLSKIPKGISWAPNMQFTEYSLPHRMFHKVSETVTWRISGDAWPYRGLIQFQPAPWKLLKYNLGVTFRKDNRKDLLKSLLNLFFSPGKMECWIEEEWK